MAVTQQHTAVTGNVTAVLDLLCYLQYNNIFTIWNEFLWTIFVVIPEFIGETEEKHDNLLGTGTT